MLIIIEPNIYLLEICLISIFNSFVLYSTFYKPINFVLRFFNAFLKNNQKLKYRPIKTMLN